MPDFNTWVILLNNQSEEIGEKQLSDFSSRGGQISALMHIALYMTVARDDGSHYNHDIWPH